MADISLEAAYMIAIWVESILYGLNLKFYFTYIFLIIFKRKPRNINRVILYTATAMIILSTVHVSIGFYRIFEGFVNRRNMPGGPGAFISNVSLPHSIAMLVVHTLNTMLGDGIVVWRCYIVWDRSWKICVPLVVLILATTGCGFAQASVLISDAPAALRHLNTGYSPLTFFSPVISPWSTALYFLSLFTNVLATLLIAARIWFINRRLSMITTAASRLLPMTRKVLSLVVETGLIYSTAMIAQIALYSVGSNAFYIIYDPLTQLMGIAPMLILVWTGLGYATSPEMPEEAKRRIPSLYASNGTAGGLSKLESNGSYESPI